MTSEEHRESKSYSEIAAGSTNLSEIRQVEQLDSLGLSIHLSKAEFFYLELYLYTTRSNVFVRRDMLANTITIFRTGSAMILYGTGQFQGMLSNV